ncbi:phage major capsid protein [Mesorhizobium sp. M1334]|uniref:phage major capsid protein n=1 Tax=Mesorhizobium sp. M1334 TaxID=2957084 RepID=UPI0033354F8B
MPKLHELQEARATAVVNMRALADLADTEKRDLTADEETKFGTFKTTIADLDKKIGRAQTLADAERTAPAIVHGRLGDGAYEERARDFSVVKAIRASLPRDVGGGGVDAGFEIEISQEVQRRAARPFQGIAVPDQVFEVERRTLLVGSSGADLVPNPHRADLFIDRLRTALVMGRLGATVLDNLVGSPIDIPRQTGSSTAQWVAEDGSLTETDLSADDVNLAPKTCGAITSYSRRLLLNASPSIEQIVRNDLMQIIAAAIDEKAIAGDGTSNTPTGILSTSGIGSVAIGTNGGAPTWQSVLDLIAELETDNAEGRAFLTNPKFVKKARGTVKVASTDSVMIQESPNELAGYPLASTNAVPSNLTKGTANAVCSALIFGNFSDLLIGYWTGIDILLNPYETTAYAKGRVLVRAMRDVDVQVRHAESFAAIKDITTT